MRRLPIDPPRPSRLVASALLAAAFAGLGLPASAQAQTAAKKAGEPEVAETPAPAASYVGREKLTAYFEFDGLDAHEEAWGKTAAHRMLYDTSLGSMLEEVGVALFERASSWLPNRKINGADAVAAVKHLARKGFVAGFNADPATPRGVRGVLVLRGATTRENRALFSRVVASFMSPASKHRIERKGATQVVVVPPTDWDGKAQDQGWAWWGARGDLGIALHQPSDAEQALASVEGKRPNLVGFEPVEALAKPDAGVTPVLKAYIDPSASPASAASPFAASFDRIEYRWGFQDEALAGVTRIVAPKPRRGALAFLDEPAFEAKKLLPIPDGVEYFASASLKPEQWASLVSGMFSSGPAKEQYDGIVESLKTRNRMDLEKDLLGNLGPRVVVYLVPSTSAAAVDEPQAPNLADPTALLSVMGPRMPKPVLVAEVGDAGRFARALDAGMLEVNRRIKAAATEQIAEAVKAEAGAPGRDDEGGSPGDRKDRRRDEPAIPEFRLLPATGEANRTYMLNVPTSSAVKSIPAGFKPTVRLEGNFFAMSTSPEAARLAVDTLKKKSWTPPGEMAGAVEKTPDATVLLLYGDFRDANSAVLASLPGTLQTGINTAIAASERIGNPQDGRPGGFPGMMAPGMNSSSAGRGGSPSGPALGMLPMNAPGGPQGGPQGPGGQQQPAGGPDMSMIQIRVDPSHLPKADDLKAFMFPSTTTVSVDDDSIRIVTRSAFPDSMSLLGTKGVLPAMLAPAIAAAKAAAAKAAAQPQPGQPGQPGAVAPGGPGMRPPGAPGGPGMSPTPGSRRDR